MKQGIYKGKWVEVIAEEDGEILVMDKNGHEEWITTEQFDETNR